MEDLESELKSIGELVHSPKRGRLGIKYIRTCRASVKDVFVFTKIFHPPIVALPHIRLVVPIFGLEQIFDTGTPFHDLKGDLERYKGWVNKSVTMVNDHPRSIIVQDRASCRHDVQIAKWIMPIKIWFHPVCLQKLPRKNK